MHLVATQFIKRWFVERDKWESIVRLSRRRVSLTYHQEKRVSAAKLVVSMLNELEEVDVEAPRIAEALQGLVSVGIIGDEQKQELLSSKAPPRPPRNPNRPRRVSSLNDVARSKQ